MSQTDDTAQSDAEKVEAQQRLDDALRGAGDNQKPSLDGDRSGEGKDDSGGGKDDGGAKDGGEDRGGGRDE